MTLKDFLLKLIDSGMAAYGWRDEIQVSYLTEATFKIELFDQDNWLYKIKKVEVCPITKRVIIEIELIGEKENAKQKNNEINNL